MRRLPGCLLTAALVSGAATASAQRAPPTLRLELPARLSLPPSPDAREPALWTMPAFPSERFALPFPLAPRRFSFERIRPVVPTAFDVPPVLFRADATWLDAGPLTLHTLMQSSEALGLDCRLTCRALPELMLSEEARAHLGGAGPVPDNYVYLQNRWTAAPSGGFTRGASGLVSLGLGGLLDL